MNKVRLFMLLLLFMGGSLAPIFSPASATNLIEDSWNSKAQMHQARADLGIAAVDGKIYAIGGSTASGAYPPDAFANRFVGTNEVYDPTIDTWATRASMPTPRNHFAIAAHQNKIYCIGGAVGITLDERSGYYSYTTIGVNEVYDTITNSWTTKASLPFNGMKLQANVVNGQIFVMQGFYLYMYDPITDSWTNKTSMPATPLQGSGSPPVSAVVGNKIIVTGEFQTTTSLHSEQKVMIYDAETDSWSEGKTGATMVFNGAAIATTGVYAPQRVYVLGLARGTFPSLSTNQVYDPVSDTWAAASVMPTLRIGFGVAVVDDVLYVIGGYTYTSQLYGTVTPSAVNEQYIPIGYRDIPTIRIVSPSNQIYNQSSVSLNFTVNKPFTQTYYSLDNQANITIVGNTTLSGLSEGVHYVTVYAEDSGTVGVSETIAFTIATESKSSLIVPVVATLGLTVVIIVVSLFIYYKKGNN